MNFIKTGPANQVELQDKQEIHKQILENKKNEVTGETERKVGIEEFEQMSWKNIEKYIKPVNGKLFIFGKDISYWNNNAEFKEEHFEGLNNFLENKKVIKNLKEQFDKQELLINILQIWIPEAQKQSMSVWFKAFRSDHILIDINIKKINEIIEDLGVPISENIFKKDVKNIFRLMKFTENEESIIGEGDLKKIQEIFFDEKIDNKTKEIEIFDLMRYGGSSGNSEGVKKVISDKIIDTKEFKTEKELLKNPQILEYLEDDSERVNNVGHQNRRGRRLVNISLKLEELLPKRQAISLINIYNKTKSSFNYKLKISLGNENNKRLKEGRKNITLEEYKKENNIGDKILEVTLDAFKHILIYDKMDEKGIRGNENSLTGIYSNMVGLGEKKGFFSDGLTFSDDNIDNVIDFGASLAVGAVTMGVGIAATIGARTILGGARAVSIGNKISRGLRITNYVKKGTKTRAVGGFVGNSIVDGVAFHEGATIMQNILYKDIENWGDGLTDSHEIIKSIAFMGGLNSLKFVSKIKGMSPIMNYEMKVPKDYLNPTTFKKILYGTGNFGVKGVRDGTIMFGISGAIEEYIGNGWNPSVKEYLHFVALIQLMHLKDIGKTKN